MKVVLDTNVFISGIFWEGACNKIILSWKESKFTLVTSLDIISEIQYVLRDFKISLSEDLVQEWIMLITANSELVSPKEKINAVLDDPKDNMFVEAAVSANADYIVSQDNHLLKLIEYKRIKIFTPYDFLKLLA